MKQRVGQWSTEALVEQDEHEGGFDPLIGEAVAVVLLCHKLNNDDNTPGSMEAAAPGIGRSGCAKWRSNAGYAVGRESFAPRGRKLAGIQAARSPRWPTWAEGEKRLLSAIKKPYAAMHKLPW